MSVAELSEQTELLGFPLHRVAIGKIESGNRSGKLDLSELTILAAALDIPPVLLIYPDQAAGDVEVLPSVVETSWEALLWFTGESEYLYPQVGSTRHVEALERLRALRRHEDLRGQFQVATWRADDAFRGAGDENTPQVQRLTDKADRIGDEIVELRKQMTAFGISLSYVMDPNLAKDGPTFAVGTPGEGASDG